MTFPKERGSNNLKIVLIFVALLVVVGLSSYIIPVLQDSESDNQILIYVVAIAFTAILAFLIIKMNLLIRKRKKST